MFFGKRAIPGAIYLEAYIPGKRPARANLFGRLVPPFQPAAEIPNDHPLPSSWMEREGGR